MFERFDEPARRVVVLAQEEARLLNHSYIGTEHILLALIHEGESVAARALETMGIGLDSVRQQVVDIIGQGSRAPSGHIPFTPRAKKVLELSLREALQFGHNYIGTEHILLGLIGEGEGVGAQALLKLGADLHKVRQTVIQLLSGLPPEDQGSGYPANPYARQLDEDPPEPFAVPEFAQSRHDIGEPPELRSGGVIGHVSPLRIGPRDIGLLVLVIAGVLAGDSGSAWYTAGAIAAIVGVVLATVRTLPWSWRADERWARLVRIPASLSIGTAALLFFASAI